MSFFKKFIKKGDEESRQPAQASTPPSGMQPMDPSLQRKFARGIQYNMKVIIRGDRNVGKSTLFYRLQGHKFKEDYIPSEEIQVTSIQWNYKTTDDIVKVDVWDIVDKSRKKKTDGLKLTNEEDEPSQPSLDADFVDVYQGTHAVVMMIDVTKKWTFSYAEKNLPLVPSSIPVLVLANHVDMGEHRTVDKDVIVYFIESLDRGDDGAPIRYAESSMQNGFGLKYLHNFFNIPFLKLQRSTLLKQLEVNDQDYSATLEELDLLEEGADQSYSRYMVVLEDMHKKQLQQSKATRSSASTPPISARSSTNTPPTGSPAGPRKPAFVSTASSSSLSTPTSSTQSASTPTTKSGFFSNMFQKKGKESPEVTAKTDTKVSESTLAAAPTGPVKNMDDFVPAEDSAVPLDFFDDDTPKKSSKQPPRVTTTLDDSDSDSDAGNPMVRGFDELLSDEDTLATPTPSRPSGVMASATLGISSSEEDEPAAEASPDPPSSIDLGFDFLNTSELSAAQAHIPSSSALSSALTQKGKRKVSRKSRAKTAGSASEDSSSDSESDDDDDNDRPVVSVFSDIIPEGFGLGGGASSLMPVTVPVLTPSVRGHSTLTSKDLLGLAINDNGDEDSDDVAPAVFIADVDSDTEEEKPTPKHSGKVAGGLSLSHKADRASETVQNPEIKKKKKKRTDLEEPAKPKKTKTKKKTKEHKESSADGAASSSTKTRRKKSKSEQAPSEPTGEDALELFLAS